jgi:hypothetical protein
VNLAGQFTRHSHIFTKTIDFVDDNSDVFSGPEKELVLP